MAEQSFVKGGRTWVYDTSVSGTFKGIFYETNENEFNRVKNKNYTIATNPDAPVSQQITETITGERYTGRVPDPNNPDDRSKDKFYVQTLSFENDNGTWKSAVLPPGQETANGNATQTRAILADTGLKQQITGSPASPNVATTQPSSPQITGSTSSTSANIDLNLRSKDEPSSYVYPTTMNENQDFIRFRIFKLKKNPNADITQVPEILKRTGGGKGPFGIQADLDSYEGPIGSPIILPIQASIVDQNSVNWGGGELNELQRMLAGASAAGMGSRLDIAGAFGVTLDKIKTDIKENDKGFTNILYGALLEQAVNAPGLTSRLFGGVLNPNMELLFQGPQLRPFNFTFKMSPRSKPEADTVKKIIRAFKKNMAPKVEGIFLQAPNVFKIEYVHGKTNKDHKSINLIKMCSLQNCSVDYTPLQTYMTFDDVSDPEASMVSYNMSLTFSEITPVYQDDYDYDVTDHPIGF